MVSRSTPGGRSRRPRGRLLAAVVAAAALLAACRSGRRADRLDPMEQPFRKVTPPVAFEMLRDAPYLAIVDLRSEEEFRGPLGHLNGARNLPMSELRENYRDLLDLKPQTFLVYCRRDECHGEAMEFLLSHGFDDAVLIDGGIERWIAGGFGTVERSDDGAGPPAEKRRRSDGSTRHRAEAEPPPPDSLRPPS
jgi:rhodanese-related sulfurtransferase